MIPEVGGIYPQRDVNVCTACHGDPSPVVVETFVSGQQMSLPWSRWKKSQGIATDIRIHPLGLWVSRQNVTAIHPIVIDTAAGTWRTDRTTERPHPVNIVSFLNKLQHLKLYAFIHHIFMPFFISTYCISHQVQSHRAESRRRRSDRLSEIIRFTRMEDLLSRAADLH